ncbi:protein of unknown function DUF4283 [Macleaya cordata]|uniref:DUF4283 domain-containing protein n=1 Tax=Macleaya cordata TaxID=56857 RepID=A0A200QIR5_MACCD|nr:protein of unknown function DUF4283 [Macleaya cordata]
MVEKIWGVEGKISVFPMETGYFLFRFSCVEDKIRVLESSDLWHYKHRPLVLREWDWKLKFDNYEMKSIPVWVKIYNLPLFLWSSSFFSKLGSGLGIPLYVDQKTKNRERLAYAMLCIEVNASKPLPASLNISVTGVDYQLNLEYEWRPLRCANYCTFRHIKSNLLPKYVSSKDLILFCLVLISLYGGYLQMK